MDLVWEDLPQLIVTPSAAATTTSVSQATPSPPTSPAPAQDTLPGPVLHQQSC